MEDAQIVELYFARSEQAIVETDTKYGGYCYSIAYNILCSPEDAEESVSDTYLAAWRAMPPRRPSILATFLGKITRHLSIDRWRSRSAYKRGGGEMPLALEELITQDALINQQYLLLRVQTIVNGKLTAVKTGTGVDIFTNVCEGGILEYSEDYDENGHPYHAYYQMTGDECLLVDSVFQDRGTGYWYRMSGGKEGKVITEQEAMSVIGSYKRIELDSKAFPEYPFR